MHEFLKLIINHTASISVAVSIIGLIFVVLRYLVVKKKSKIDFKEHKDKHKPFNIYLFDFYRIIQPDKIFLIFNIKLTNHANSKNSYTPKLEIEYFTENKKKNRITLYHQTKLFKEIKFKDLTQLDSHIRLNEKEIASGWLIFDLPKHLYESRINIYAISISDTENNTLEIESYISKDIVNEDSKL